MHHETATRWLTVQEFAAELGVPISTAYKRSAAGTRSGRFPVHTKPPDGCIRIRRDRLEAGLTSMKSTDRPASSGRPAAFRMGSRTSRLLTLAHLANPHQASQTTCTDLQAGKLPAVNVGRQSRMPAGALDRGRIGYARGAQVRW